MNVTALLDKIIQSFIPERKVMEHREVDQSINSIAPERIKRSPGHQNISELAEEPEWYHE